MTDPSQPDSTHESGAHGSTPRETGTGAARSHRRPDPPGAIRGVVPIPRPAPNPTPWVIALAITFVVSLVLVVIAHLIGGNVVPSRFGDMGTDAGKPDPTAPIRIIPRVPNPPMSDNRPVSGRGNTPPTQEQLDRLAATVRWTVGRPRVPELVQVGEPADTCVAWLQQMVDYEWFERFDFLAEEFDGPVHYLYYVANAYVGMTREHIERELHCFAFTSPAELARGLEEQIRELDRNLGERHDDSIQLQLDRLRENRDKLLASTKDLLTGHRVVDRRDPTYARLMKQ
ncbi:MAG: hypothetical protein AB7K09_16035 [Planctomycetota bacterium]